MAHRILLVDDSATVQQLIKLAVADEGIEVAVAASLSGAEDQLRAGTPQLVLVDVSLPDGDGYMLCRQVKSNPLTAGVPVLLLASARDPLDEQRAREAGADGALSKPFQSISALIETVKDLLAGRSPNASSDSSRAALEDAVLEVADRYSKPESKPFFDTVASGAALAVEPEPVLELDEIVIPSPFLEPQPHAPASSQPQISESVIEEIAERVTRRLEERLGREIIDRAVPEVVRLAVTMIAEEMADKAPAPPANPPLDIDVA